MVRGADGSVIIDTELDSSDVNLGAKEVEKRINSLLSAVDRLGAKFEKAAAGYASNAGEILSREFANNTEGIGEKLKALGEVKIPTDEYKRVCEEIEKTDAQMEKLTARKEKMQAIGVPEDSKQWESLYYDISRLEDQYASLAAKKAEMEASGSAFINGSETEEYQRLSAELERVQNAMEVTRGQRFAGVMRAFGEAVRVTALHAMNLGKRFAQIGFNAVAAGAKKAANGLKAFISFARKAVSGLKSLKSQTRKTDLSTMGLVKSLTSLKRLLITRIKRMFISAIFNDVREGIQQLAKYSSAFNQQMSNMKNSAAQLSGNISVLIGNVISVVEPVITRIINLFAQGVDWINQFIAALQGKSTYTSAAKGADSYADATDKATKAQKNLNRELYSFDELNRQSGNDGDNGSSDASAITYVDKPITLPGAVTDWIERLKGAWENADWKGVGRVIADGINAVFGKLDSLISWENIGDTITRIVTGIADILNSMVEGIDWQKIGRTFGSGINTIVNTLYLLLTSIDWYAIGKALATGLNGLVGRVDWDKLGRLFGARINALFDTIRGFAENFKWGDAGTAFGNTVNALKNEVNWYNLGDSLKKLLKGAVALMQYAVKTIEWGDAGTKFAEALNAFFKRDSLWADAGNTIDTTIKGLLDFTEKAVITFNEKQFADDLKAMFGSVDWDGIVTQAWGLMKLAFQKAGSFVNALLNESIDPEKAGTSGEYLARVTAFNQQNLGEKLGTKLSEALNTAISMIPWKDIGVTFNELLNNGLDFLNNFVKNFDADGFVDGVCNALDEVEWAKIANKIVTLLLEAIGKFDSMLRESIYRFFGVEDKDKQLEMKVTQMASELFAAGAYASLQEAEKAAKDFYGVGENLAENAIDGGMNKMQERQQEVNETAENAGTETMEAYFNAFKEEIMDNGHVMSAYKGSIEEIFGSVDGFEDGSLTAKDFYDGWNKSVKDSETPTATLLKSAMDYVVSQMEKETLEQGSPSKRAERSGKWLMEGFAQGAKDKEAETKTGTVGIFESIFAGIVASAGAMVLLNLAVTTGMNTMATTISTKLSEVSNNFTTTWNNVKTFTSSAWSSIQNNTQASLNSLASIVSSKFSGMLSSIQSMGWYGVGLSIASNIRSGIENNIAWVGGAASSMSSGISAAFDNQNWFGVGYNIAAGIHDGLSQNWPWLRSTVENLAYNLYQAACRELGIRSPSKVFAEIGNYVDAGLQQGLEEGERGVLQTAANIADAVTHEMTPDGPEVDITAEGMVGSMQAVIRGLGGVADTFRVILDTIRSMGGILTPQIAAGTVVPYKTKIDTTGSDNDDIIATLETLNGDLESVIIQAVNNAVIALVEAIQNNGGGNRTMDVKTLTSQVVDEINRRTRAQGSSPILI